MAQRKRAKVDDEGRRVWTGADVAAAQVRARIAFLVDQRFEGNTRKAARATGIPHRTLARLADPRSMHSPTYETMHRVADAFRVSAEWIMTGREHLDPFRTPATFRQHLASLQLPDDVLEAAAVLPETPWRASLALAAYRGRTEPAAVALGYEPYLAAVQAWNDWLARARATYGDKAVAEWFTRSLPVLRAGFLGPDWPAPHWDATASAEELDRIRRLSQPAPKAKRGGRA